MEGKERKGKEMKGNEMKGNERNGILSKQNKRKCESRKIEFEVFL